MLDRQYNRITLQCDECGTSDEAADGESFEDFWKAHKRDGWRASKVGDDWVHACPDCQYGAHR